MKFAVFCDLAGCTNTDATSTEPQTFLALALDLSMGTGLALSAKVNDLAVWAATAVCAILF